MKSRLNRRINAVRKNIVVKKHLLNKLEKIKRDRKARVQLPRRTMRRTIRRKPIRRSTRRTSIRRPIRRSRKPLPINSLKLPYLKKIRNLNNIFPKSRKNTYNSNNNNHICKFKNFHEEDIEIPHTYPGDLWVHNNLVVDRDKPLKYFDEDYLKEVYANHRKICYGI